MSDTNHDSKMIANAQFILGHLKLESTYLDSVIESSLEMQGILRERRSGQPAPTDSDNVISENESADAGESERSQRMNQRLVELRSTIAEQFLPVLESRRKLVEVLKSISPNQDRTPSVTSLALMVDEPLRGRLKKLRNEIRNKLNQVQSISMGNQAVLIYTLDFYGRLLTGLTQDDRQSNYYDANGRSQSHFAGSFVQTNC